LTCGDSYGPKGKVAYKFTLVEWAKRPEVQQAWKEIAAKNNLVLKVLNDPNDYIFGFGTRFYARGDPLVMG
jgi:hypothetical protein